MLFMMLFAKYVNFEPICAGAIKQILHPEYPAGKLFYDPHHNHDYIVAFATKLFGCRDDLTYIAWFFWFLEMAFSILVLIKICNFVFKRNRLVLTIAVMFFIISRSGEVDQKTMLLPIYFTAIYFFLKERWLVSALLGASIFYLHVGYAIWWFLPSSFALLVISLIHKRAALKKVINYVLVVIACSSPIIYFYLNRIGSAGMDKFSVRYYYYVCGGTSSILLSLRNPAVLVYPMLMVAIFLAGYSKARKEGYKNNNIMPIAVGVFATYIATFIFADLAGNGAVITLQLLRSTVNIEFFSSLFFAFLLAKQIERGDYTFFLSFVILRQFYYIFFIKIMRNVDYYSAANVLYFIFLIYVIFENRLKKGASKGNQLLQRPIVIALFLILVTAPRPVMLKSCIKSILHIPQANSGAAVWTAHDYLRKDIAKFTNEQMADKNTLLLIPFDETDFVYYTKHKVFITWFTPIENHTYKGQSSYEFENILKDDLKYPPEKLFSNSDFHKQWQGLWRGLKEDTIRLWKQKYNVTHVVREKELPLNFPILYENQFYVVYEIDC